MIPPLPKEPVPGSGNQKQGKVRNKEQRQNSQYQEEEDDEEDGWEHYFDDNTQRFFFYNKKSKVKQWINPRVPADDEFNKNLPVFEPPKLPFEKQEEVEETPFDLKLKNLKQDEEFTKLSTFEKYQYVQKLKSEFEKERTRNGDEKDGKIQTAETLRESLKDIKPFKQDTNFNEFGSTSENSRILNNAILSLNNDTSKLKKSGQNESPKKITKKQLKQFNKRKKQQREDKLMKWLTRD